MGRLGERFAALKELDSEVRAILTTGYGLDGKAQEILDLGMRGFLQKPFTVTALAEKVSQVLAGSTSL